MAGLNGHQASEAASADQTGSGRRDPTLGIAGGCRVRLIPGDQFVAAADRESRLVVPAGTQLIESISTQSIACVTEAHRCVWCHRVDRWPQNIKFLKWGGQCLLPSGAAPHSDCLVRISINDNQLGLLADPQ